MGHTPKGGIVRLRKTTKTITRRALFAMLGACVLCISTLSRADLLGVDVGVLTQILAESILQYERMGEQLIRLGQQLAAAQQMLHPLNEPAFEDVVRLLTDSDQKYRDLTGNVHAIAYMLATVDREFQQAFPDDVALARARFSDFDPLYVRWQNEIVAASRVAARAQSSLEDLQANTNAATMILTRARSSDGLLGQMQAAVAMIGVLQGQLNTLIRSMDATGRVTSAMAAASASEKRAARERARRARVGYTHRGAPLQGLVSVIPPRSP